MNFHLNRKLLLLALTILVGLGLAFALPVLVRAQHTLNQAESAPDNLVFGYSTWNNNIICQPFPRTASNQTELDNAILCYSNITVADQYTVTLDSDINLITSTPSISNTTPGVSLYINGAGFTVDGQHIPGVRPFEILSDTYVTITDITIQNGNIGGPVDNGGGIRNEGHLNLLNIQIYDSGADVGGGLINTSNGNVIIEESLFAGNFAYYDGGGISNQGNGKLILIDSLVATNDASRGNGGGIINSENGQMVIKNSTIASNRTFAETGAGIYLSGSGKSTIDNSTFIENDSGSWGGGIYVDGSHQLNLSHSAIISNTAVNLGGGIVVGSNSKINMINTTVSSNLVATDTLKSDTGGGGIAIHQSAQMYLDYSTVVSNTTPALAVRDGIYITGTASMTMSSSIIANHNQDCTNFSSFNDSGYNLVEDGTCITNATNLSGDPLVGPLHYYGDEPFTNALLDGSKAIDHIPPGAVGCGTVVNDDQRGYGRPANIDCDIGAYERGLLYYQPVIFKD